MKKIFLLSLTILGFFTGFSQVNSFEKAAALQLVTDNQKEIGISTNEISNSVVASTYKNKFPATTMVYLQQTYKGIPVYNQIQTLAFKNGKLVSKAGERITNIEQFVNSKYNAPNTSAADAVTAALSNKKLTPTSKPIALSQKDNGHQVEFGDLGVSHKNISAELMWFPNETGKTNVALGWQVYIIQKTSSDYWLINVDAVDYSILSTGNLTVYCNWDDPAHKNNHEHKTQKPVLKEGNGADFNKNAKLSEGIINSPSIVNTANYRVVPYPAESPIHPGGTPVIVSNPWNLSGPGNAATLLNWHSVGTTNYNITRGNNVWAQEDQNNNNGTSANQVTSPTSPDPLNFDFIPDFSTIPTQSSPVENMQFNTTNLFYWNNIIHDLTYQYGFDEASRNFQADNLGKGGIAGDYVFADAQDGGGTNNANFSTPADGGNGRMQMYIWTAANPDRDGDVDNGIISHEYAHGISNRLTGNGSSCLQNAEQMGEGWSDYYSLMYTQNWATSTLNTGFDSPRGIGTYTSNQAITGLGIRTQRYCTNFAVNNRSYAATISTSQHTRGEIWCATLWDMTWGIINQVGSINPNLFNAAGAGGNSIALKLVTEGMKLQPCSPGFISGRDAILQADQILYGGAYRCTILEAFRRRGMGLGASQGSSASVTDQIPSFANGGSSIVLIQGGITAVPEGQNINYTNRVTADACSAFTNFTITDTLPTNVTYVSGGSYNAATRVVSFNVNQAAGTVGNYNFVVNINPGTYFAPVTLFTEPVPASMPATWSPVTTVPAGGNLWTVSALQSNSAPNAFFVENEVISTDKRLELVTGIALPTGASAYHKLNFWHRYNTEGDWDGGVIEVSTDGGASWADLGSNMLTNRYNSLLGAGTGNNLSNREAFSGLIPAFINTTINLTPFAGQTAKIRFRFASDDNTAGTGTPTGWFVDDINLTNTATVSMRSSFFNASMVRVNFADTVTLILPGTVTPPVISVQPSNATVCAGATATFTSGATGSSVTYSWEVSTNAGVSWSPVVPAVTTTTLTLTGVTIGMNNNRYRMVATNTGGSVTTNGLAILTVNAVPSAPTVTTPIAYCQGATATALTATGTGLLWYTAATGGTGSATAPTPTTTAAGTTIFYVSQTVSTCESPRAAITVNVTATPAAPTVTSPISYCQNATATALTATGTNLLWYTVATGGTGTATAPTPSTATVGSTTFYVSQTTGVCEGPRTAITVTITAVPAAPVVTTPISYCQGVTATALTATGTNLLWYTVATGGTGSATAPTPSTATVGSTTFYVSQTTGCESPRAAIVVNVVAGTTAPTVATPVAYCQGATATQLTATGTGLLWYTAATGGTGSATAPTPTTTAAGSTIYYVSQTSGICESPRAAITVNVTATPAAPAVTSPISYCQNATATALTAIGTNLKWYTVATGGIALPGAPTPSTATLGTTIYYVSQSTGTCEGPRAAITVNVVAVTAAPTAATPITYCQGATATALTATGTNLLWYTVATGGTGSATAPTPSTATIGSTTFYVSQTTGCGESPRTAIVVTINATPSAPTATTPIAYCQGATATALTATGTGLLWYTAATGGTGSTTAPTPSTATVGSTTFYVSQTTGVCEGPRAAIVVNVTALPVAPTGTTPIAYCQGATATALTATGTGLLWYTTATGGIGSTTAPIPNTTIVGSITYYVSQTTGTCEGPRAVITVTVNAIPAAPTVSTAVVYCQGATAIALTATGTNLLWYTTATGGIGSTTAPIPTTTTVGNTIYYVTQTATNCESPRAAITVTVNATPVAPTVTSPVSYCQGGTAVALTATGTNLKWYTAATGGTGSATAPTPSTATVGSATFYVSQTTGVCEGPRAAIVVNVNAGPAITLQPVDINTCATTATFTATASGTNLTYQWFLSTDGGATYTAMTGQTSSTLVLSGLTSAQTNNKYRLVVSSASCSAVTSNAVSVKVGTNPVVVLTAAPVVAFNPYTNGGLFTTVSPVGNYTYLWKRNNNTISNTTTSITKANGLLDDFGSYQVTVTDAATGCFGVSNVVSVSDIPSTNEQLFASPNPTNGMVRISYYSSTTAPQARTITIYDEKGARLMNKNLTFVGRYGSVDIDLSRQIAGTYIFILRDASGQELAAQKVIKY